MQLIRRYDSPFVRRVGVSMHVLGMAFEHVALSPFSQADALRRFNPLGRMPVLVLDDGVAIPDSVAILDHLDEASGGRLMPAGGAARREAWRIISLAVGLAEKAVALNYERRRPDERQHRPWIDRCLAQIAAGATALEDVAWDARLTQPEITTACALAYADRMVPLLRHHPALAALSQRCEAHPAFRQCTA